jgi:hypothetical protein
VTLSHTAAAAAEQQELQGEAKAKELVNLSLSITCCRHEEEVEEATAAYIIISRLFPLGQLGCCCCCCCFVRESVL